VATFFALLWSPSSILGRDKKSGHEDEYKYCRGNECFRSKIPIHQAVKGANFEEIKSIISSGDDVNERDYSGSTALSLAILSNQSKIVEYLLQHGADPNSDDNLIKNLIEKNDIINLEKMFKAGVSISGEEGKNVPLVTAIIMKKKQLIDMLIKSGAKVNIADGDGKSPLSSAVDAKGAVLNALEGFQSSKGDKSSKDPIVKQKNEQRKLKLKELNYWSSLVKLILDGGADPKKSTKHGTTPLHSAARYLDVDTARLLVAKGADPNAVNDSGNTPLVEVFSFGNQSNSGQLGIVTQLVSDGANVNYMPTKNNNRGEYIIHLAAIYGTPESINYLIKQKVDVNAQDTYGFTPLHRVAEVFNAKKYEMLFLNGADPRLKNVKNEDSVYVALNSYNNKNKVNEIRALLAKLKII
jgi:cytohesin